MRSRAISRSLRPYVGLSSIYAMLLIAGAIVIAYLLFIDREIGSRSST